MSGSKIVFVVTLLLSSLSARAQTVKCYGTFEDLRSGEKINMIAGDQDDPRIQKYSSKGRTLQPWVKTEMAEPFKKYSVLKTANLEFQLSRGAISLNSAYEELDMILKIDGEIVGVAAGSSASERIAFLQKSDKANVSLTCKLRN